MWFLTIQNRTGKIGLYWFANKSDWIQVWKTNWSRPSMILNGSWTTSRVGLKWPLDVQETKSMVTKLAILCFLFDHYKLLQSLTSNPHHDSYLCFIGRILDLRTSTLEGHALQWKYHSLITTVFMSFPKSRSVYRSTHGSRKTPSRLWYNDVSLKRQEFPSRLRFKAVLYL